MSSRIAIAGCGVFGVTAALELGRRGHEVVVLEASAPPAPLAASTDISKIVRLEYGSEATYTELAERALVGWRAWGERWAAAGHPHLVHETGILFLRRGPMEPGGFEHDSWTTLTSRGHPLERLSGDELARRFPAWAPSFVDGYFNPVGGYVESAAAVWALVGEARAAGVEIRERSPVRGLLTEGGRVTGLATEDGVAHRAEHVLLATGSWTAEILPELAPVLERHYQPVWHLRPRRPELFRSDVFPVFTADISRTGYYGFPLHAVHGVVKTGHHGDPIEVEPGAPLAPPDEATTRLFDFLAAAIPPLADSELVHATLCPYCDTPDEHFWIARDPGRTGLTVAAGGSGHAFKFAPLLGGLIADAVEGRDNPLAELFRWRPEVQAARGFEPSRCRS